ncbi:MAG: ABC transporter ATP-binding protein [candidate division WOR-3 bacterium]
MIVLGLFKRVGRYWKAFLLAMHLLMISSIVEVSIPQVVRHTIDNYILPKYARDKKTGEFVDITKIPKWEIGERVYPERYYKTPKGYILSDSLFSLPYDQIVSLREEDLNRIRIMFLILITLLLIRFMSSYGWTYLGNKVAQEISHDIRMETFEHALKLPISYFNKTPLGVVLTRLTNDVSSIAQAYSEGFLVMFKDILMFFIALGFMFNISAKLTLIVLSLIPLVLVFSYAFSVIVSRAWANIRNLIARLNAFIQESVWGLKLIQNLGVFFEMGKRFQRINEDLYKAYMRVVYIFGVFLPLISLMSYIAIAIIIWYSAGGILKNEITFGSLVAFLSYVDMLFQPISEFSQRLQNIQSSVAGYEKVVAFLSEKEETFSGEGSHMDTDSVIKFNNVSFSYDGEKYAVLGINLDIKVGEKIALVGRTGSGKTTLLNLMMGFYVPTEGSVEVFGMDTRKWDKRLLRSLFAPVMQELTVFADTLKNNITLGYDIDYENILKELGITHLLNKDYTQLSSGEKQLVAIARALAFNRPIIIFDETTSNIDALTELKIQRILKEMFVQKTMIIVAHRLTTAVIADKIVVLHNGRVVEMGTHSELMAKKGIYYNLYNLQVGV